MSLMKALSRWSLELVILLLVLLWFPVALYAPLWLRSTGSGGASLKSGGISVETCRFVYHGRPTIEATGGVTCELEK